VAATLFVTGGTAAAAVAAALCASEGPFAQAARLGLPDRDPRRRLAARELGELGRLAHADWRARLDPLGLADALADGSGSLDGDRPPATRALAGRLAAQADWDVLVDDLAAFHRSEGVGALATHRVLRLDGTHGLAGVPAPDAITLAELEGGEAVRAPLLADLRRFVAGRRPNDALLYGPPGTGKSATVRAAAAAHADDGLRLVQLDRQDVARLPEIFARLSEPGPRCLVFLDDLVFDDDGRTDRALRAALEGGVGRRPENVLVWVTSNRLRLTHDTYSERADALDEAEARLEKGALVERFGRRVRFGRPDQDAYLAIVHALVRRRLGAVPDGLDAAALRFARTGHGPSPRTARQFAATWDGDDAV
jgi:hypothetical protein